MNTIVVLIAAATSGFSAVASFLRPAWITESLNLYGVPESWWNWLGAAKAAGAVGLVVGLAIPPIGVAAAIGLVLYYCGAVIAVVRAKVFAHVVFPIVYLVPVAIALGTA